VTHRRLPLFAAQTRPDWVSLPPVVRLIAALPTHAWLPATPTCHCPSALLPHVARHMASTTLHTNELHHRQTAATNMPPPGIDALARDGRTTMTKRRDHRLKDGLPSEPQAPNAGAIDYYIHSGYVPARSLHRRIAQQSSLEKEARPRMATDVPSRTLGSKKFTRPFHLGIGDSTNNICPPLLRSPPIPRTRQILNNIPAIGKCYTANSSSHSARVGARAIVALIN